MAKIKFGMMMTDARGKLGGQVFSKNRAGAYIRTKVTPSNPQTQAQMQSRSLLGTLSVGWNALTDEQRASWNGAVDSWAKTDVFGDIKKPSGKNLYVSLNKNLGLVSLPFIETAPEKKEMQDLSRVSFVSDGEQLLVGSADGIPLPLSNYAIFATPVLPQGVSNAKNRFRHLVNITTTSMEGTDIYDAYVAKFGAFAVDSNIQLLIKEIAENGQAGVPIKAKLSFVETP